MESVCTTCKTSKPVNSFSVRRDRPTGRDYACKECRRLEKRLSYQRVKQAGYAKRDPVKQAARSKVASLLKSGKLVKAPCFLCGDEETVAHHLHYDFADKVVWLCVNHHYGVHSGSR